MGKFVLKICLIICITSISFAQKSHFKTGIPSPKKYYSEIKYEDVRGKIIIPVTIQDKTYRFLFDTGAPNLISKTLLKKIDSKRVKNLSVTDANQKKQTMELVTIPKLTVGEVTFKNTSSLVFDGVNNLVFDCFKIDGIIGSNLLRKSIVQIRSKEQLLILTNNSKKLKLDKKSASELMLKGNQSSPYINIKLKGEYSGSENLLFDTGASGFYDLCKKNYKIIGSKNIAKVISKSKGSSSVGMFGVADISEQYKLKIPELIINNQSFKNVITVTGNDDNSRIGSDLLYYGIVTLNFIKKVFYFESFSETNDLDEKLFGFDATFENNKLVVGFVWDDDLKNKIQFGDEIIEINGVNYENNDICSFISKPSIFKKNKTLDFIIKSKNGDIVKLTLHKK